MSNVWNLSGQDAHQSMPFAGSCRKITAVNARDQYRQDHHRNLFGTDQSTPFSKQQKSKWETSNNLVAPDTTKFVPTAGGSMAASSGSEDPRMQWVKQVNTMTPADYTTGAKHSDDQLIEMFRQMVAQRSVRGFLNLHRQLIQQDTNGSGTLDIQEFWKVLGDLRLPIS